MMCPDHRAIDHVGGCIAPRQLAQRLEHGIEHAGRDPASIAPEHAVPLDVLIGQMPTLRDGTGDPHPDFEIGEVLLFRAASTTIFSRQKRPAPFPLFFCTSDYLATKST